MAEPLSTFEQLQKYFCQDQSLIEGELESKKDLQDDFQQQFEADLESGINPLLAFNVLYHRLSQVSEVANDVFYEPAIQWMHDNLDEDENSLELFGTKTSLRTRENIETIKSPKIMKLEKEIAKVEEDNKDVLNAYEKYQNDVKSIKKQIKAEQERLATNPNMVTKREVSESISLSY